jgi:DNA-binding transcriptional LysR family regulator
MIHELRHIRAFLKIAETRNFTRAASDLHVSQSALTVQVQQLEESLGIRLFDRNKRGVTLTAAGKDVFGPLQRLFNDAQTIVAHARDLSSASTGFVSSLTSSEPNPSVSTTCVVKGSRCRSRPDPGVYAAAWK